jgi:hypothetical protein
LAQRAKWKGFLRQLVSYRVAPYAATADKPAADFLVGPS